MSLGFAREIDVYSLTDTAELYAYLYDKDDAPEDPEEVVSADFLVQKPDGTRSTFSGQVQDDGSGYLAYTDTDTVGQYRVVATFVITGGVRRSTRTDFEVIDPFDPPAPSHTEVAAEFTWRKIEDCFDAEDEGPWLRDMTLNYFNEWKMQEFLGEALFELNERNPPTHLPIDYFFVADGEPSADLPLLAQGMFLCVVRHLMRSYVEQPAVQGAQVVWQDRRDYLTRWQTMYETEYKVYNQNATLFKRRFLGLGMSAMLVDTKAGRLLPAPLRVRTTGRGYF